MRFRGLDVSLHEGPTLDDTTIDEICALRAQFMRLKPGVDPVDDRTQVAAWLRAPGCTVAMARDRAGALQSLIDMNARHVEHGGHDYVVCYSNFGFASLAYRNHPAYAIGNLGNLLIQGYRHGLNPRLLWTGAVYPASFIAIARTFPRVWACSEPDAPSGLVSVVDDVAPRIFGESWLPDERLVRMRTLPPPHASKSPEGQAALRRYEARNPRWQEGYGLMFVVPLTLSNLVGAARLALRRLA